MEGLYCTPHPNNWWRGISHVQEDFYGRYGG